MTTTTDSKPTKATNRFDQIQSRGRRHMTDVGFHSFREEAWRHTNFKPMLAVKFAPPMPAKGDDAAALFAKLTFRDQAAAELVFVNGFFDPKLSRTTTLPAGALVQRFADAKGEARQDLHDVLGSLIKPESNGFVAQNSSSFEDGVLVHVPSDVKINQPIHLLFLTTPGSDPIMTAPRTLVVIGDRSDVTLVETYVGAEGSVYCTNAVTEIVAGDESVVDHYKLNQESKKAFHVAAIEARIGANTRLVSHNATLGGRLTRNDCNCTLAGEYAYPILNGLVIIGQDQHCDNHTLLNHTHPNCPSYELYKHVLDGNATCVFKGKIFVDAIAQKTDAKQSSKTLLLSDKAQMHAQPALEIYADDVKCTHGSTTGPVDDEAIFYLQTRGVGYEQSRRLLTYAFAADVTRRIKVEPVRAFLETFMAFQHQLPQDLRIQELGQHDDDAVY